MARLLPSLRSAPAPFLALLFHIVLARAAFWTATSNYMLSTSTSTYTYRSTSLDLYTRTSIRTIKQGATPTGSVISSTTSTDTYYDILYTRITYAQGAVGESDLLSSTLFNSDEYYRSTSTYYYMDVTFTAPASCPTQFTYKTSVSVTVPTPVTDQVTPKSTKTGTPVTYESYVRPYVTYILSDGAAPFTSTSAFFYRYYIASCSSPYSPASTTTSRGSGGSGGSSRNGNTSWEVCSWYTGCTSLKTWIIVIATILPTIFALGFLESWFWFRRLMLGKACLRFGTVCWIFLSLWIACFTRKQGSRSKEDQVLLREKWNALGGRAAFKLWFKWGFRHQYPTELLGTYSKTSVGTGSDTVLPTANDTAPGTGPNGGAPQMQQQGQPIYYQPGTYPQQHPQQPYGPVPIPNQPQSSYSAVSPVSSSVPTAVPTPQPQYAQPNGQQQPVMQYYDPGQPPNTTFAATGTPTPPPQAAPQPQPQAPRAPESVPPVVTVPQNLQQPATAPAPPAPSAPSGNP
ncbi:hypothetical protein B0J11DRAFT_538750 [Dendryphion nanum]|uniref:Uncharacterized protein n=1 Tax=Dendryphion nanum TaxID=256645 RepID=A0A9P9IDI6_9PLEO|nr:hypothetical protein B0J11DRAFT_538750 [Dendryphion nanum]